METIWKMIPRVLLLCMCIVFSCEGADAMKKGNSPQILLRGKEVKTAGLRVRNGQTAPDFTGVAVDLKNIHLSDFKGKRVVLNIFPSMDTPTCAQSVRTFNREASEMENTVVLCLSMDLPFAQKRFCTVEGLTRVIPLSLFRSKDFVKHFGLRILEGPMEGLTARAVIVVDETGKIIHTELVRELSHEPDYKAVMEVLKTAK